MHTLYAHLRRYWKLCAAVIVLAAINQVFSLLDPIIFRHLIDGYVTRAMDFTAPEFFKGVSFLLLLGIGTAFVSRVAKNFQDYYLNTVTQRVGADIYQDGVRHSLALPYEVFEDQRSGETLGILQKARQDSGTYLGLLINMFFISLVGFVFVAIYAATIHWSIAFVFAVTVPIVGTVSYVLSHKIKGLQKVIVAETAALAGSTTESLRNIELVKGLGLAAQEIGRLNTVTDKILELELKKLRYVRSLDFVQGTLVNLLRTLIILFLAYLIFIQTITFGEFYSVWMYTFFVFGYLQQLGTVINSYREAEASMQRYDAILAMTPEPVPAAPKTLGRVSNLSFDNVSFAYKTASNQAIANVSFSVQTGQTVAFVGPSGSGKTSLIKLLVGLYQPTAGDVQYNNTSIRDIDLAELRSQIGFVTQDTQLFSGTIKDNLLFVRPDATDEEMLDALHKSAAGGLLARATDGINTVIGEGGVKISGGEKQRLSIARALLRKPSILVFDEATSALDSLTEEEITSTVRELRGTQERLTILIAHRLSTIMHADVIYVLEKGVISEQGTHEELLAQKGLYYAMWRQQVGER